MSPNQSKHPGDMPSDCDRHHDKRIKLAEDVQQPPAHPFESVDYWLEFDDDAPQEEIKTETDTSFDNCFSQWLESSKAAEAASTADSYDETPMSLEPSDANNTQFFLETPSPDVDDALKLMNLDENWNSLDATPQSQPGLFSDFFPPTPRSEASLQQLPQAFGGQVPVTLPSQPQSSSFLADNDKLSLLSLALNLGPFLPAASSFGPAALCRESQSHSQSPGSDGRSTQRKARKSSAAATPAPVAAASASCSKNKARHVDRAAHNDIERRYRTNLKHKIAELQAAIPTLQSAEDADDGSGGEGASSKVSKGTVLTKATEYIHHLEERNKVMEAQHQALIRRLQAVEILLDAKCSGMSLAARVNAVKNGQQSST